MKKISYILGVTLVAIAAWFFMHKAEMDSNPNNRELPTFKVSKGTLAKRSTATGVVKSQVGAEVKVGSQLSGVVKRLYVNIGDKVKKGDLLAKLDDAELLVDVERIKSNIHAETVELNFAKRQLERIRKVPNTSTSEIEENEKNVAVIFSRLHRAKADLEGVKVKLGYTELHAPISGTIASVSTYQGETVAASFAAPTFVTIVDLQRLEIHAYVDEADIGSIKSGQPVEFSLDSYSGNEFSGQVRMIYPKAEIINNVVNYIVIIDIENSDDFLIRPDMTTQVYFTLEEKQNVIFVPRKSLLHENGRNYVIVKSDNQWKKQPVRIGLKNTQQVEIISGLHVGDTVVSDKQTWKDLMAEG